jgi:hypothetical protein
LKYIAVIKTDFTSASSQIFLEFPSQTEQMFGKDFVQEKAVA